MKDIVGNELAIGDPVATDVMSNKQSHLRVGVISAFEKGYVRVYYKTSNFEGKEIGRSVLRKGSGVIKVVNGVQT